MFHKCVMATAVLIGALQTTQAHASTTLSAGAVYSQAAGGLWIAVHGQLGGCQTGFAITASTANRYIVTILNSGNKICPQIVFWRDAAHFYPMASKPRSVGIQMPHSSQAFPYSVGSSDPEKM
jgi:hypothetical protein